MADLKQRIEHIRNCAEERSKLQLLCLDKINLSILKTSDDLAQSRIDYEQCLKDNKSNYPTIVKRDQLLNPTSF
jgi:hypothetical protein